MQDPSRSRAAHQSAEPFVRWSRPESERAGSALLVVLHGLGADENDLFGIVPELPEKFTVASVRAPLALDYGGFSWFPVTPQLAADPHEVRSSVEGLQRWVASQREQFASTSLLGFSMGMAMATSLLRIEPEAYACTVGLSGFAIDPGESPLAGVFDDDAVTAVRPKVFWGRDQHDPMIDPQMIAYTRSWASDRVQLTEQLYTGVGHGISPREVRDVSEFLGAAVG
ncbi:hypothetical protein GCM10022261_21680 [Brevibacterium daeguense]|uniref:Phospholipase/carboxylesterase/thioesterase domain-containing protein n=1 Tax=Brevibacterium daeguense TaxID=909936 RepID=A0ABP8EKZ2_9MICO|nr:phospholipase [Brevibacterium daeguense]